MRRRKQRPFLWALLLAPMVGPLAACGPKPAQPPARTAADAAREQRAAANPAREQRRRALDAYERDDLHATIFFGQRYLEQAPDDRHLTATVGYAACRTGDGGLAKKILARLDASRERVLRALCRSHGTRLDTASPRPFNGKKDPTAYLGRAWAAYQAGHLHAALLWGERYLEQNPSDRPLRAMVVATACMLGDIKGARRLEKRLRSGRRKELHAFCTERGVVLRPKKGDKGKVNAARPDAQRQRASDKLRDETWAAYRSGRSRATVKLGKRYLQLNPKNQQILSIVGASACKLKDANTAQRMLERLHPARRNMLLNFCAKRDVSLRLPMERFDPRATASARRPAKDGRRELSAKDKRRARELRDKAWSAYRRNQNQLAVKLGRQYLRLFPRDQAILSITGASACKLGDHATAKMCASRLQTARVGMLRDFCRARGVALD